MNEVSASARAGQERRYHGCGGIERRRIRCAGSRFGREDCARRANWIGYARGQPRAPVRLVEPYGFTKVSALGVEEQRVNVISDFVDNHKGLGDGYRVETHIVIWTSQNVMKVPISAIFRRGQNGSVSLIVGKYAELRDIDAGHRNKSEVEILDGLSEGDRVIVHPPSELRAGTRVRFDWQRI